MRFDKAVNHKIGKYLKKIRIKVDPCYASSECFDDIDGYEGYVLQENHNVVRIMVIKTGMPIFDVNPSALLPNDNLTNFKLFALKTLNIKSGDPVEVQLKNSPSLEETEVFLKQHGVSVDNLCGLYRQFLQNENN